MAVAQRGKCEKHPEHGGWCPWCETPANPGWRPGDPFPAEARDRSIAWLYDVARANGKILLVNGERVGHDGKPLTE